MGGGWVVDRGWMGGGWVVDRGWMGVACFTRLCCLFNWRFNEYYSIKFLSLRSPLPPL